MALSLSRLPSPSPPPIPPPTKHRNLPPPLKSTLNFNFTTTTTTTILTAKTHRFSSFTVKAAEEQQPTTTESESEPEPEPTTTTPSDDELSDLGTEIKKAMMEREIKKEDDSLWGGVAEEIGQIEWPAFNKVVGTTGVVLGVIAGSSVVLLTVNAVLAELSDRVFAGRGVQDFFG